MTEKPFTITFSDGHTADYDYDLLVSLSDYFVHKASYGSERQVVFARQDDCMDVDYDMMGTCTQRDFECLIAIYVNSGYMPDSANPIEQVHRLMQLAEFFSMHENIHSYLDRGIAHQRAFLSQMSPMALQITMSESRIRKQNTEEGLMDSSCRRGASPELCSCIAQFRDPQIYEVDDACRILGKYTPPTCGRLNSGCLQDKLTECEKQILRLPFVVIAGGKALDVLLHSEEHIKGNRVRMNVIDVDIFIHAPDTEMAFQLGAEIMNIIERCYWDVQVQKTEHAINMHTKGYHWQIILRLYTSVAQILHGFDISACKCALVSNGSLPKALATASCLYAIANRTIIVDPERNSTSYVARLLKYCISKKFSLIVPGLDRTCVDADIYSEPINALTNLRSLLRNEMEYSRRMEWRSQNRENTMESTVLSRVLFHTRQSTSDYNAKSTSWQMPSWTWLKYYNPFARRTETLDWSDIVWKVDDPGAQTLNGSFHSLASQNFYNC